MWKLISMVATNPKLLGVLRHLIGFAGAALVAKGYISPETSSSLTEVLSGGLMSALAAFASISAKEKQVAGQLTINPNDPNVEPYGASGDALPEGSPQYDPQPSVTAQPVVVPSGTKEKLLDKLLKEEGGFVNHESDPGGKTKYGVTEEVAQRLLHKSARDVTWEDALFVAEMSYWRPSQCDSLLASLDEEVAYKMLTIAYNAGQSRAAKFLQIGVNAFNRGGQDYADITVDGDIGSGTLRAIQGLINKRGQKLAAELLYKALLVQQGQHYLSLTHKDQKFEQFSVGWFDNRL